MKAENSVRHLAADPLSGGPAPAASAALRIRPMTAGDLPFADGVRDAAGWNQTRADWRRFLEWEPAGCYVAEDEGAPVGTATTVCYGADLAWIGMVLVHRDRRRRGAGRALLQHCIAALRERGIRSIKLDATPLGLPLYHSLGFIEEWTLTRWHIAAGPALSADLTVEPLGDADWPAVLALDDAVFGAPRHRVLRGLVSGSRGACVHRDAAGAVDGFGVLRAGSRALYAGPIVAANAAAGVAVLGALLAEARGGAVFCDAPDHNAPAVEFLERAGFTRQRPFVRLWLGGNPRPGIPARIFAIADPAIG
jgi:ribosomal protein S18 acetylase RimI-like enzyme